MKALSPADQLFLWLEKRQQPMHVGGLQLFSFPEGAGPKYVTELAELLRTYSEPEYPFNQRLTKRLGSYYWKEDHHFDLEHHFRHEALPKPGRIRELLTHISAEHSNLMDRQRPLWECHLIEGVRGRRFALYNKAHHSLIDGMSAIRMATRALSNDPNAKDLPPWWAMQPKKREATSPTATDFISSLTQLSNSAGKQLSTIPTVIREVYKSVQQANENPDTVSIFQAPQCILNAPITGSRRFAAQSYSMDRIKAIGKAMRATMNDVVLAICGSALRNYLINQHALPDQPLIAMVPVSLRKDDSEGGNQIAMILANLGTHIADPSDRLSVIKASVKDAKKRMSQMTPEEALNYTALTMAPTGLNLLTGLAPGLQAFNVVISNVPGPKKACYWNGAKLEGMYPVSIPLDGIALNITLLSYEDQLEFGLTACRRTLPSMQRLLDYLENGIKELEVAADL
ncbi:WS/DGAT/MGAT family O-acyltransferase [Alkalimarinus coralli]|uniref:WS/DGAT/MGAT family O-acyltransferase n=1 Tax=Alkalimarinus coralli TaxID=2935863 RepID=UPI00202AD59C|nr:wax ester/triacylglycerol synthase family O-acyltransferase [Alkalimarinus coralli]